MPTPDPAGPSPGEGIDFDLGSLLPPLDPMAPPEEAADRKAIEADLEALLRKVPPRVREIVTMCLGAEEAAIQGAENVPDVEIGVCRQKGPAAGGARESWLLGLVLTAPPGTPGTDGDDVRWYPIGFVSADPLTMRHYATEFLRDSRTVEEMIEAGDFFLIGMPGTYEDEDEPENPGE